MKILRPIFLVILSAVYVGTAYAADDVSASEKKKILELMDIIGAKNIGRQVSVSFAQQLSYGLKQSSGHRSPGLQVVAAVTDEELSKRSGAIAKMVPLCKRYGADLDALLVLRTIGRKTVRRYGTDAGEHGARDHESGLGTQNQERNRNFAPTGF
jgi:hypothetical protein